MRNLVWSLGGALTIILLVFAGSILKGQKKPDELDMVKVAPKNCTVLLDNDRVRVTRVVLKPGEQIGMHRHPLGDIWMPRIDAKVRSTPLGGKSQDNDVKADYAYWSNAETHSVENIGKTEYTSVVIELKR